RRLGEARLDAAYPWRTLLDNAVRVISGSDFPVESEKPMWGIYSAVTRQTHLQNPRGGWQPKERMSVNEALQSFTTEASFARFMESEKGMIKEGMLSDMTILDRDIRGISPEEILSAEVLATIVNGELVYQSF
ncbi:MAG: amidohydrolase family protein, partial [Chloroflexota bacterium]|nr:amidohydrolase family protein [Chloroflexota bacterium]